MAQNNSSLDEPQAILRHWSTLNTSPSRSIELFDEVRAKCPVVHSGEYDGFYVPMNYSDVREVDRNYEVFSAASQITRPTLPRPPLPGLEMDPPQHGEWRALYNQAIKGAPVLMEQFTRYETASRIENFIERGSCDIVQELSATVPAIVVCHLLGVSEKELALEIQRRSSSMFSAQGDPDLFGERQEQFAEVVMAELYRRREEPRDDFLSYLATVEVEGKPLTEEQYIVLLGAFMGAGHHTTTSAITSMVYEVLSNDELRSRLLKDPSAIPAAVDETLRLHPPLFGFFRKTTQDTELADTHIPAGSDVYVNFAGANRDPAMFECPHQFNPDRPGVRRHLSFGAGIHACPGAPLAKMELRVILEELLARVPDMSLASSPEFAFDAGEFHSIPSLPVKFTPRARQVVEAPQEQEG